MTTPLLENILNQAEALKEVSAYQFGPGREAIRQAAELIRSSKQVVLTGMGASYFACIPFQYSLSDLGFSVVLAETAELLYFPTPYFKPDTSFLLVSRSGESIEVTKLFQPLNQCGSKIIGVTNVPQSSLDKHANCSLVLHSPADQLVAIQTYVATAAVLSLLLAELTGEGERARDELAATADILRTTLPVWVAARDTWRGFFETDAPLYLLGRGASMGAVSEGMLLMHETAKAPAVGMSVAQFRHGPVEVVDHSFRVVVFGGQPVTAALDARLAGDVIAMGGQARWIGPAVEECQAEPLVTWPSAVPARFASIVETIPLQIAAYLKAEIRGILPGSFRWAPAITSTETGFLI